MKIIPRTDGRYGITQDGRVINLRNNKEVAQGRPGSVKIYYDEMRTTIKISDLIYISADEPEQPEPNIKGRPQIEKTLLEQFMEQESKNYSAISTMKKLLKRAEDQIVMLKQELSELKSK